MTYVIFDTETTITSRFKRKANPFNNLNKVVAVGWFRQGDEKNSGDYYPTAKLEDGSYSGGAPDGWLEPLLKGTTFLVGHNIKFDLLHALCAGPLNRKSFLDYISSGGQIWDTQLAEYLLYGQAKEYQMVSLDEVAPRYGGNLKHNAVKSLWEAGVDTPYIDKDMLMEYLLGYESWHDAPHPADEQDEGDIGNTKKVFLGQVEALKAIKGLRSALLNMGALVATVEMEFNGLYVDLSWALGHAETLKADLVATTESLNSYIPEGIPFEFNWGSTVHKSALIFGGSVKYKARMPILNDDGHQVYSTKEETCVLLENGGTVPLDEWNEGNIVFAPVRFSGGKNKGEVKTKRVKVEDLNKPKSRIDELSFSFPGFTRPESKWASATPGVYSTAADVIDELGNRNIPFLKALAKRAEIQKDLSTYFIITDDETGKSKGMLTLVGPDNVVHHELHMVRTVTGRLSSSNPNAQNLSKGAHDEETGELSGSQVKRAFVSRFEGGSIIQSDFTNLEIYVQASLAKCKQLIADLAASLDMHVLRASQAWGKASGQTYESILSAVKDSSHPSHVEWKNKRQMAKTFSFQRAFGAGVAKIAATTGMDEEKIKSLIEAEEERYPELVEYIKRLTETVQGNRIPTNRFCQHPDVEGLVCQLGISHYVTPDGKMYTFTESPSPKFIAERPKSRGGTPQSFNPTELKNYTVQGTGGEWTKAAMWLVIRALYKKESFGGRVCLVNTVHDAVYLDAAPEAAQDAAALLHACMLEASNLMEHWFKWPQPIMVPSETTLGPNMMSDFKPGPEFKDKSAEYRSWIRKTFIDNHIPQYEKAKA